MELVLFYRDTSKEPFPICDDNINGVTYDGLKLIGGGGKLIISAGVLKTCFKGKEKRGVPYSKNIGTGHNCTIQTFQVGFQWMIQCFRYKVYSF